MVIFNTFKPQYLDTQTVSDNPEILNTDLQKLKNYTLAFFALALSNSI